MRPAASIPVAWMCPFGCGAIHTSCQAGGMTSSRSRASVVRIPRPAHRPGRRRASPGRAGAARTPVDPGRYAATAPETRTALSTSATAASTSSRRRAAIVGWLPTPSHLRQSASPAQSTRCRGRSGGGPHRAGGTGPKSTHRRGAVRGGQVGDPGVPADHQPGVRPPARPARRGRSGRPAPPSGGRPGRARPPGRASARSSAEPVTTTRCPGRRSCRASAANRSAGHRLAGTLLPGMQHGRHRGRPRPVPAGAAPGRRGRPGCRTRPAAGTTGPPRARRRASAGRRGSRRPGWRRRAAAPGRRPASSRCDCGPRPCRLTATCGGATGQPERAIQPVGGHQPVDAADQVDQRGQPAGRGQRQLLRRVRGPQRRAAPAPRWPGRRRRAPAARGSRVRRLLLGADHHLAHRAAGRLAAART